MAAKLAGKKSGFGLEGETRMPAATMGSRAQRTSRLIQDKAREVFLAKGYFGTSIEDIADAAEVSRASFYTYFPSKRDVLIRIGQEAYEATHATLDEMMAVAEAARDDALEQIVGLYLDLLDEHGAFVEVWGQATFGDEELRQAGMRAKLAGAKRLSGVLEALGWVPADQDGPRIALAFEVMMDRYWFYWRVAGLRASRKEVVAALSTVMAGTVNGQK